MEGPLADAPEPPPRLDGALPHRLDLRGSIGVVTGSMVGVGIFLAPPEMARQLGSPGPFFAVWILTAAAALIGASVYGALGAARPRSGGDVVYQREAFGPGVAFATGQLQLFGVFCGSAAVIAAAMGQYQLSATLGVDLSVTGLTLPGGHLLPASRIIGAAVILGLTAVHAGGLHLADRVQRLLAWFPVAALALLSLGAVGAAAVGALPAPAPAPPPAWDASALVGAWLAAHFAWSGWNAVVYVAAEVDDPARTLPTAMRRGTLLVAGLYLLINLAFVAGLGMAGLAGAGEAGTALAERLGGPGAGRAMNALIGVGLLGTVHATLLGGARVARELALHGDLPRGIGALDGRGTPLAALGLQGAVAAALVLTNSADALLSSVALAMVGVGGLSAAAALRLPLGLRPGVRALAVAHLGIGLLVLGVELRAALLHGEALPLAGVAAWSGLALIGHLRKR